MDDEHRKFIKLMFLQTLSEEFSSDAEINLIQIGIAKQKRTFAGLSCVFSYSEKDSKMRRLLKNEEEECNGNEHIELFVESVIPRYSDVTFREHFRMSRECFEVLCKSVATAIKAASPKQHVSVTIEKQCLLFLWTLANREPFRTIGDRFGMLRGAAHYLYFKMLDIVCGMADNLIRWPTREEMILTQMEFERKSGIPGIVGAVDGYHILIKEPVENKERYYNRKGATSVLLQGVCDYNLRFIDVHIGHPGSVHDARVFKVSSLFQKLSSSLFLPNNGHIIADSAYPLLPYVMTPYRDNGHLSAIQKKYNYRLSSVRSTIERTFGRLRGKWRRLKHLDMDRVDMVSKVIMAACCLHNFLLLNCQELLNNDCDDDDSVETNVDSNVSEECLSVTESTLAVEKRNLLAENLM